MTLAEEGCAAVFRVHSLVGRMLLTGHCTFAASMVDGYLNE